jgi:hypothetical protein
MILFLFLPLELLLCPHHDLKTCSAILHFENTRSHNFSIIKTHTILFFLEHLRPESVGRAGTLNSKPSPTEELLQKQELLFWRVANSTQVHEQGAFQGPPRPS